MPREHYCTACSSTAIAEREMAQRVPNYTKTVLPLMTAANRRPVFVCCFRGSDSARDLVDALVDLGVPARRLRNQEQLNARVTAGRGTLIGWGEELTNIGTLAALNRSPLKDKLVEIQKLKAGGVTVPDFIVAPSNQATAAGYLGRTRTHQAAQDLLHPGAAPVAFYTKKLNVTEEWRVHVFNDESIRVGKKVPNPATGTPHAWIRSRASGWNLDYGASLRGNPKRELIRGMAKAAVSVLGYNFGAVDTGITADGQVVVFEVNTAPSIATENTAVAYAKAIARSMGVTVPE